MMKELNSVRQVAGEPRRRWFGSDTMDLIVWLDAAETPVGFQFCYDKGSAEKALTWKLGSGFSHMGVDDGEGNSRLSYKATPILVANGKFNGARVVQLLDTHGAEVPSELRQFVATRILECTRPPGAAPA
jgi:hypothetical protein